MFSKMLYVRVMKEWLEFLRFWIAEKAWNVLKNSMTRISRIPISCFFYLKPSNDQSSLKHAFRHILLFIMYQENYGYDHCDHQNGGQNSFLEICRHSKDAKWSKWVESWAVDFKTLRYTSWTSSNCFHMVLSSWD